MKEMIKQKMMKRLHRRNSSSSSTASVDCKSGERFEFSFSSLQALQVPRGWDKLSVSLISVETGKTISKTGKASVWNGNCRWTETLSEYISVSRDEASKELEQCLYTLLVSMGSSRSGILGEVTINLSGHLSSDTSLPIALPLKKCNHGTILQVQIQCLTPRGNLGNDRWKDSDSLAEDADAYDELDNTSETSDGRFTKSLGSSTSNDFPYASHAGGHGSREASLSAGGSHRSFDSMEDSFGRESCSPHSNLSEVVNDIGRHDSSGYQNSALYNSYHAYDSPKSNHSPYSSVSGKHILSQRQESGKASHSIPASPLRTSGSSEFVLEGEGTTMEDLRSEARMWERNARKLMLDLDLSRKEFRDQTKTLEHVTMELSEARTECDGLKHEINHLKVLLGESVEKEKVADSLKIQVQDKDDIHKELEEEIKFQKELNDDLSLQLNKTQESNLELVSVLQELEDTIEKQRLKIEKLSALKVQEVGTGISKIEKVSYDTDDEDSSIENPKTDFLMQIEENDKWKLESQLQQFLESQSKLENTILYLEKSLEEKTQEIQLKNRTLLDSQSEWTKKLSLKDEEICKLEAKLSAALSAQVVEKIESHARETPDLIEEVKALKDKVQELESDCTELTDENLELLFKLKELSKDLSTSVTSNSIKDPKVIELECQIQQLKEEAKKRELDGVAAGYSGKACYLDGELEKYRAIAEEQENEISSLKQLLEHQRGEPESSITQEKQADDVRLPKDNVQCGEDEMKLMIKDPCNLENEIENNSKYKCDELEKLNVELKSRVDDLDKELLAKISEIEVLKSDCLLKEEDIQTQRCRQEDLETQLSDLQIVKSQLEGTLKALQRDETITYECLGKVKNDMVVLNVTKDSHISAKKILEKKLIELESRNHELELHLAELEEENLHLSERISGLEPQLRYLTDARESSRLEVQHFETRVLNLQTEVKRLEKEIEMNKADMRGKLQDMQKRWLEAQEECEYLKKANPKLQANAENLIEECSSLQKSNGELRQQRLELHNHCTVLEAELRESQHNFSKLSKDLEDLEEKFSVMLNGIASKEKKFDSELDALYMQNKEQTEKLVMSESLLNQLYSEKMVEVENLQQEVAHLSTQISATHDERSRMASDAVLEMHVLRTDKDKLEKAIEDLEEKFRSSEKKLHTVQAEYETRILELTSELAASRQNHGVLEANLEKLMELLENTRSSKEKLKSTVGELDANLKSCEYQSLQLTEENSSLKGQLQKIPLLQDEVVSLKNSLNDVKYENERLEASLQMMSGEYEELKEAKTSLFQKSSSMQKVVAELEDHKHSKIALEEKLLRLQGDLTAREALSAQDAELKNELGRLKRSNSQLQWKINCLREEKDECMKKVQALEEKSDNSSSPHEAMKPSQDLETAKIDGITIDAASRIRSLENELAEALEANDNYKLQLNSLLSKRQDVPVELDIEDEAIKKEEKNGTSLLESELRELQERYLHMSLKYAEVEAQREELVLKLKTVRPGKSWFS